ncbi:MAG: 3-isopropylmalate dehydrogenase, partial [Nitrospirae bacterium CG_4_9_14_3_um_filter_51_5]
MPDSPQAEFPLLSSPAFQRADSDPEFLQREELRAVRLQLEWFKPELIQQDEGIESTIVVFGSARLLEPAAANAKLVTAKHELAASPHDSPK